VGQIRRGLSAGRVQSIALRLIANANGKLKSLKKEEYWTVAAKLQRKEGASPSFEAALTEQNEKKIEQVITLKLFAGDYKTRKSIIANEKRRLR